MTGISETDAIACAVITLTDVRAEVHKLIDRGASAADIGDFIDSMYSAGVLDLMHMPGGLGALAHVQSIYDAKVANASENQ